MMKNNIWIKTGIFKMIKNIFDKKEKNKEYNTKLEETKKEDNVINEFKQERKIAELQKKYENNVIIEEDLTETEKENLVKLYKEQIDTIENNIQTELTELDFYKQKIILARKKAKMQ